MSWLPILIIPTGIMDRNPVIPKRGCFGGPFESQLDINIFLVYVIKIIQDDIALSLIESYDVFGHGSIDKQRLPASSWMNTNEWMHSLNVLRSSIGIVTVQISVCTNIDGFLAIYNLAKVWRKFGVC
jgi:hypothetical protein